MQTIIREAMTFVWLESRQLVFVGPAERVGPVVSFGCFSILGGDD